MGRLAFQVYITSYQNYDLFPGVSGFPHQLTPFFTHQNLPHLLHQRCLHEAAFLFLRLLGRTKRSIPQEQFPSVGGRSRRSWMLVVKMVGVDQFWGKSRVYPLKGPYRIEFSPWNILCCHVSTEFFFEKKKTPKLPHILGSTQKMGKVGPKKQASHLFGDSGLGVVWERYLGGKFESGCVAKMEVISNLVI